MNMRMPATHLVGATNGWQKEFSRTRVSNSGLKNHDDDLPLLRPLGKSSTILVRLYDFVEGRNRRNARTLRQNTSCADEDRVQLRILKKAEYHGGVDRAQDDGLLLHGFRSTP